MSTDHAKDRSAQLVIRQLRAVHFPGPFGQLMRELLMHASNWRVEERGHLLARVERFDAETWSVQPHMVPRNLREFVTYRADREGD